MCLCVPGPGVTAACTLHSALLTVETWVPIWLADLVKNQSSFCLLPVLSKFSKF